MNRSQKTSATYMDHSKKTAGTYMDHSQKRAGTYMGLLRKEQEPIYTILRNYDRLGFHDTLLMNVPLFFGG